MKRTGLTPLLASATLFLVGTGPGPLAAQDTMANSPAAKAARRADELLKRYDRNGDGKLDDDERADAKEAMMKEQVDRQMLRMTALPGGLEQFRTQALAMFDRNRDGQLDEDERAAAQKFASRSGEAPDLKELVARFDKNGDGQLDNEERGTAESFLKELRGLGAAHMRTELLRRFDRNSNGRIDDEETAEMEKLVRPRIENSPLQLPRHDTNRDGKLDDAEWATARTMILQWLNASGPAALEPETARENDARSTAAPAGGKITSSTKTSAEIEQARLEAVAREVERRRKIREANGTSPLSK